MVVLSRIKPKMTGIYPDIIDSIRVFSHSLIEQYNKMYGVDCEIKRKIEYKYDNLYKAYGIVSSNRSKEDIVSTSTRLILINFESSLFLNQTSSPITAIVPCSTLLLGDIISIRDTWFYQVLEPIETYYELYDIVKLTGMMKVGN